MNRTVIPVALFGLLCAVARGAEPGGPVARWDFAEGRDSHIHDTSGHKNHGLGEHISWVELKEGYALEFDGQAAHVNCGRGSGLDLTGPLSLEAWIFPTAPAASETGIAGKSFFSYGMTYYTDGRAYWYINDGGNKSSGPVAVKRWSHVVGTFDGKTLRTYVNGRLTEAAPSNHKTVKHGGDFLIGRIAKGAPTRSFKGVIGSVRVYDRALPEQEVRAHYQVEVKRYPKSPPKYSRMVVTPYLYLDKGQIVLDADLSYLHPYDEATKVSVELRRAGSDQVLQRHDLPKIPNSGELKDVQIKVGRLDEGDYELRVALASKEGVRSQCVFPFSYPQKLSVPPPSERTAPPLPPPPKPVDCPTALGNGGGFTIELKGDRYAIESTFSYPHGGENVLSVPGERAAGAEPDWTVRTERVDAGTYRVTAAGKHYALKRTVAHRPGRVLVKDALTNTSRAPLGIMLSNHVLTGQHTGLCTRTPANPSVFLHKAGVGLGMTVLDDVFLEQYQTFAAGGRAGIRSNTFALDTGASYTLEWAVYLNESGDYYDFVNQVRKDAGYCPTVEGGFAFTDRRKSPSEDYVRARALKYASIGCLGHPADDPSLSLEGVEFVEYPKECALLKATFAETRRRYPDMKVMFHIAHSLYTTHKPEALFGDSRVLNAAGKQTDYGGQNKAYYRKYFSNERVEEGYRWYIFYPTMDNSFGKVMLKAIDYMLEEIGVNGMFADGFTHGYGGRFTYDRWDGHTAEIDPKTKTIKRKYASVNLLAQDVLVEVCRRVAARGGIVIANSYPGTRTVHREKILYCLETAAGGKVCARLHLAPSVIALGNPGKCETARDVYDDIRDKLEWGGLYFYYGEKAVPADTIVTRMYPITVEEIHAGTINGRERIITLRSGVYGWPASDALHLVTRYDARGVPAAHGSLTTVGGGGVRTPVELARSEAAVVEKIPVSLAASDPVNVLTRRYDESGIELIVSGTGSATVTVRDGAFAVRSGKRYELIVNGRVQRVAAKDNTLSFPIPLGRQVSVKIGK